jgi:hypothetical protein
MGILSAAERGERDGSSGDGRESAARRLCHLQNGLSDHAIPFRDLLDVVGPGATGLLLLLIGAAGLVPGSAPVFGAALCVLALGLIAGRETPWIPAWLGNRRISGEGLKRGIGWLAPRLEWLEQHVRPRRRYLLGGPMLRLVGLACLINGVLIVLPIPFGNTAPALAVLVLALALTARDGVAVVAGLALSALALAIDLGFIFLGYQGLASLFGLIR